MDINKELDNLCLVDEIGIDEDGNPFAVINKKPIKKLFADFLKAERLENKFGGGGDDYSDGWNDGFNESLAEQLQHYLEELNK